eukprot:Sspe_Gene.98939::Locus_72345_Transcript_2_2_Confidence_0.750_Length_1419::g.98939::m.98939/K01586/lysA; diaminopimelate decarboxylase
MEGLTTPAYTYDLDVLEKTLDAVQREAAGYHMHYAMKANCDPKILEAMRRRGFGVDCVSGWEVQRAREAGFADEKIVFAGVGKTDDEMRRAQGVLFHCESVEEIAVLNSLATSPVTVALRVNPNIDAQTHDFITTGKEDNKFGIPARDVLRVVEWLGSLRNVKLVGLHFHIGSQITSMAPFAALCKFIAALLPRLPPLPYLNVGGGLGVDYSSPSSIPDFGEYFTTFRRGLPGLPLHFELGRSLVAQCGSLVTRVLYVKAGRFVVVDAGMNDLLRPALYNAHHTIENLSSGSGTTARYDVVGPICESADVFARGVLLPHTSRGDVLAIRSAGAYGEVMSMNYNLRPKARVMYSSLTHMRAKL